MFINLSSRVNLSGAWNNKMLQHLWRYNLHYFEYLYALANEYINSNNPEYYYKYKYFVDNWIDNNPIALGDGWHPYTVSLRITNWISTYQIFIKNIQNDKAFNRKLSESIYTQFVCLKSLTKKDVLGNHYLENIKALIIGSIFFYDTKIKNVMTKKLLKQLSEQIIEDGMHFELRIMYHDIVLEDIIKIAYWLKDESIYMYLVQYIQKMLDVSYSFNNKLARIPAFNDCANGISKDYRILEEVCKKIF